MFVADQQGQIIGDLECLEQETNHSEFVIVVRREYRKVGVGSKLLGALVDWAESQRGRVRLQAKVLERNEDSIGLLERFDFCKFP